MCAARSPSVAGGVCCRVPARRKLLTTPFRPVRAALPLRRGTLVHGKLTGRGTDTVEPWNGGGGAEPPRRAGGDGGGSGGDGDGGGDGGRGGWKGVSPLTVLAIFYLVVFWPASVACGRKEAAQDAAVAAAMKRGEGGAAPWTSVIVVALDDPAAALEALTRLRPRTIPGVRDSVVVLSQEAPSVHDASLMKFGARIHRAGKPSLGAALNDAAKDCKGSVLFFVTAGPGLDPRTMPVAAAMLDAPGAVVAGPGTALPWQVALMAAMPRAFARGMRLASLSGGLAVRKDDLLHPDVGGFPEKHWRPDFALCARLHMRGPTSAPRRSLRGRVALSG